MENAKKKRKELTPEEKQQKINALMEELQKEKEKGKNFILSLLSSKKVYGRWQSYFDIKAEYLIQNAIRNGITEKHSGKMEGMQSYSTCCAINKACQRAAQNKEIICSHCYAQTLLKQRKSLSLKTAYNAGIISTKVLTLDCMPIINAKYFRLEAFGDLENTIQAINYCYLIYKNKQTFFAWFTKRYELICEALIWLENHNQKRIANWFKRSNKARNFNIISSNYFVDDPNHETRAELLYKYYECANIQFSVYSTLEKMEEMNIKQNCQKKCIECLLCYKLHDDTSKLFEIYELLK